MPEPTTDELLAQEYLQLVKTIDEFDSRALTIKAWSVTFSAAGLAAAYVEGQKMILLIAALSALVFWVVEALWKVSQRGHYPRIEEIEAHFSAPDAPRTVPFRVRAARRTAFGTWRKELRALEVLFFSHVALPHVAVFALGMILYAWAPPAAVAG